MATPFMYKALLAAALAIALSLLLAATTTASPACSNTVGALQLEPPAAPSNCSAQTVHYRDRRDPYSNFTYTRVSWRDNSSKEDGFTVEVWLKNSSRVWVLAQSLNLAANSTVFGAYAVGPDYKYRVKAFNASGDSAWSDWAR